MKNSEKIVPRKLKEYIMKSFQKSKKRHLLITGSKGIGKTTLLKEILKDKNNFGGIKSYVVKGEDSLPKTVILEDILDSNINTIIGKRIGNTMNAVIKGFEDTGLDILKRYNKSNKDTMVIDEIGFLESEAPNYQKELLSLSKEKNMIVVLRKENNPFINKVMKIENAFLVDLDRDIQNMIP